jgi:hypothetical protein
LPHRHAATSVLQFTVLGVAFAILATANAAGYRYGVSDQAFYIPVVVRDLDPAAFPRDASLIDAQGRLMLADEVLAAIVGTTGLSIDTLFFAAYVCSLALTWAGLSAIGARVYTSAWGTIALGAAFTLRHRIPRTSVNSFEPYFHPRMLAFAICLMAVAALLRRRLVLAVVVVAISAVIHVTTALWFSMLIGVALGVLEPRVRPVVVFTAAVALIGGVWAFTAGPLSTRMDDVWLQAVASKDSLFATQWPWWAWAANLALLAALWWAHRKRRSDGTATAEEAGLVWGSTALVVFFLATVPLIVARVAFPVQLQISRIFWLVDVIATIYVLSLLRSERAMRVAAAVLVAVSIARGAYVMLIERPDRAMFALHLPESDWTDAMAWVATEPLDVHVLADPGHSWKYGTSVRVSAQRDVFLEDVKDSAIAIYSRDVAARVVERMRVVGDFGALTAERARQLAGQYDLNYLVTEAELPLPVAYRNARFRVYSLTPVHGVQ